METYFSFYVLVVPVRSIGFAKQTLHFMIAFRVSIVSIWLPIQTNKNDSVCVKSIVEFSLNRDF